MSDYTPTTDQVREVWADYPATLPGLPTSLGEVALLDARGRAFDRWHAAEIAAAKAEALREAATEILDSGFVDSWSFSNWLDGRADQEKNDD